MIPDPRFPERAPTPARRFSFPVRPPRLGRVRIASWTALAFLAALAWPAAPAPAAPVPGYRLATTWPAAAHGLGNASAIASDPSGGIWLLDGPAGAVVAMTDDGAVREQRSVPDDALDLAIDADGDLYFGRYDPLPPRGQAVYNASRVAPDGSIVWNRRCECGTGSGVAWTPGRVWLTEKGGGMTWLGDRDGRVTGDLTEKRAAERFPADMDAGPDGTLFATDIVGGQVWSWPPPYLPGRAQAWSMLEASGPFRVGVGTQADGETVVAVLFGEGLVRAHRPDGSLLARFHVPGEPADIAVGTDARIHVLDRASGDVRVYAVGPPATPTPPPPDPPRVRGSCELVGTRTVAAAKADRCGEAVVTLTLSASCPPDAVVGAEVALLIDRSLSMSKGDQMGAARDAATRFLGGLDMRFHRASVVAFSSDAVLLHPLSNDPASIQTTVDGLRASGSGTHIEAAILTAMAHLRTEGRPNALPVLILLTDGDPTAPSAPEPDVAALAAAELARAGRAYIVTIGLGRFIDSRLLEAMASTPQDFYYSPNAVDLDRIYDTILDVVRSIGITDLVIRDRPAAPAFRLVPGSSDPPALVVDDGWQWTRPVLPVDGLVLSHTIKALLPGTQGIGPAEVRYVDADGTRRGWSFPAPSLDVQLPAAPPPGDGTPSAPATPPLPPPPPPAACPPDADWRVALSVYPDVTGFGPYACPGCSGGFRAGDHWERPSWRSPATIVVRNSAGKVLWLGPVGATPRGPSYVLARLCEPPPYRITMERLPEGYVSCPNSPPLRELNANDFQRGYSGVGFALWHGCGRPTPTPVPMLPPCP